MAHEVSACSRVAALKFPTHVRNQQVLQINHDLGGLIGDGEGSVLEGPNEQGNQAKPEKDMSNSQRNAHLRELEAMRQLRSPHTVNVYGAVTSLPDRLVLVMELLVGGDLRTLLKDAAGLLPEEQCRRIIGDICAGMSFVFLAQPEIRSR